MRRRSFPWRSERSRRSVARPTVMARSWWRSVEPNRWRCERTEDCRMTSQAWWRKTRRVKASHVEWLPIYFYLPLFPFVRGEVLPITSSPPHLIVFSILLCLLSSSSSLPPLLPKYLCFVKRDRSRVLFFSIIVRGSCCFQLYNLVGLG